MNKRFILAIILVVSALSFCIFSYFYVKNISEGMIKITEQIQENLIAEADYTKEKNELCALWNKHKQIFGILLKHGDIDNIEAQFYYIDKGYYYTDEEKFSEALSELQIALNSVLSGEELSFENIF